jgi:predicted TIM-barrel fold metal-dependent hydrolase
LSDKIGPMENAEAPVPPTGSRTRIIDSHIHVIPAGRTAGLVRWIKRAFPEHPSDEDITPDRILAELRACGVERAFNFVFPLREEETEGLNVFSRDIALEHPMLVPFGSLHIGTRRKDELAEHCITELGLAGIKVHPYAQRFEVFCDEFEPLFKALSRLGRPFVVHTGFDAFYGGTQDLSYLRATLERYPEMPVVLVHSLFPRFTLAMELLESYPQVYLDMTYRRAPEAFAGQADSTGLEGEIECFENILSHWHGRTMFGTDHPVGMGSPAQIFSDLESFDITDEARADIMYGTAQRFLRDECGID